MRERGTVLLLFPAAVLVVFLMGAVAVDVSLAQARSRELEAVAASAANDALAALDVSALRAGHGLVITPADARARVAASVAAGSLPQARVERVEISHDALDRIVISVTVALDVDLLMAPAVGDLSTITLRRTERAVVLGSDRL